MEVAKIAKDEASMEKTKQNSSNLKWRFGTAGVSQEVDCLRKR